MKREPNQIIEELYETLTIHRGEALSINRISKMSGLHFNTVQNYVKLIQRAQTLPKLEVIKSGRTTIVRTKGLLSLPEKEQLSIVREEFPTPDEGDKLFINLLKADATTKETAVKITITPLVEKLLAAGHISETENKFYLTETGKIIARGAAKMYPAV